MVYAPSQAVLISDASRHGALPAAAEIICRILSFSELMACGSEPFKSGRFWSVLIAGS